MISTWRYHGNELDVVARNDSNIDSCSLSYNRFVHDIRGRLFKRFFLFSNVAGDLLLNSNHCLHCSFFQMSLKSMSVIYFLMMMKIKVIFFRF